MRITLSIKNIPDCSRHDLCEFFHHCSCKTHAFDRTPLSNNLPQSQPAFPLALPAMGKLLCDADTPQNHPSKARDQQELELSKAIPEGTEGKMGFLPSPPLVLDKRISLIADQNVIPRHYTEQIFTVNQVEQS